jgi:hypothetical protein
MIVVTRVALWALLAVTAAILLVALAMAGLTLDIAHSYGPIVLLVIAAGLAGYYRHAPTERSKRIIELIENVALFSLISLLGALATYVVAKATAGSYGRAFAAFDRMIGYDWAASYYFVASHRGIAAIAEFAYLSIFFTPPMLITGLVLGGHVQRVRGFLFAFALALGLTIAIFALLPAQSALGYYIGSESAYSPPSGMTQDAVIAGLRSGATSRIDPSQLTGLINFPSFHAQAGILFIWATWPLRLLRYPITLLNLALIAATPVEGSHYIADVLAGVALALAVIGMMYLPHIRRRKTIVTDPAAGILAPT